MRSRSSGRSSSGDAAEGRRCPVRGPCTPASSRPSVDLPAPGRADDREPLAGPDGEVEPVQHVAARAVGEADVVGDSRSPAGSAPLGRAVVRHVGDADEPGQRGRADLQLVEPAEQPVERVEQQLHVERDGGDLAERGEAAVVRAARRAATTRHERQHERQVDEREPHRAQPQRVPLGGEASAMSSCAARQRRVLPAERLDGARAVGALGEAGGQLRVRRALAQVAGRARGAGTSACSGTARGAETSIARGHQRAGEERRRRS